MEYNWSPNDKDPGHKLNNSHGRVPTREETSIKGKVVRQDSKGIYIGCIVAKTNILVCVVGTNVPTCG